MPQLKETILCYYKIASCRTVSELYHFNYSVSTENIFQKNPLALYGINK